MVFNDTAYAHQVAKKVLEYYEELFDINYPLPKQGELFVRENEGNWKVVKCEMLLQDSVRG